MDFIVKNLDKKFTLITQREKQTIQKLKNLKRIHIDFSDKEN